MPSAGDAIEAHLRVVRVQMDALGRSLDEALEMVPQDLRAQVRERWEEERDQPIERVRVLSGTGGPRAWFSGWQPRAGYHWRRLRNYLIDRVGRSEVEVDSLDDTSDKVLSHLEDPRPEGLEHYRVNGLVLGYVQSGKTANISALIAKAADLGYKLVIVLSGMDDGLRKQTQDRLGRELGLVDDPKGVGRPQHGERWVTLTRGDLRGGDFNPGTVDSAVLQGNERVIAVAKKNAQVLRKLVNWVGGALAGLPVLVIDDEADQASINTGGNRRPADSPADALDPDEDPSTINRLIRDLLARFRRVSYVAYTATPFANVFIDPEGMDREVLQDLYPKDFIISLPRPPRYVGAERLFGRDPLDREEEAVAGLNVIRTIPPADEACLVPPPRSGGVFSPQMCTSLEQALLDFVLATAAKIERLSADDGRSTMLIHISHRTAVQNNLKGIVEGQMSVLRQKWRYERQSIRPALVERWNSDFRPVTAAVDAALDRSFEQIEPHIEVVLAHKADVRVLNITSTEVLDYSTDPNLKVIVIGGNRLSRGLTLEDLVVSYYVRDTDKYDTLLQMGRWFGYRESYVDLTRLWTTPDLARRFRNLALVEEELRDEIAIYEQARITPADFAPKIRTHPAMAITALNKLGSARPVQLSFQGELRQTTRFKLADTPWLEENLRATRAFLAGLGPPNDGERDKPGWIDVRWEEVCRFLGEYRSFQDPASFHADTLRGYIERQAESGELVRWRVSVRAHSSGHLGTENLGIQGRPEVNTINRSRRKDDHSSIGVLTSPARATGKRRQGDEEVGLTDEQIDRARARRASGDFPKLGKALRAERDRGEGLLLVYPVSRYSKPDGDNRIDLFDEPDMACTVIGLAMVFPPSDSAATVEYMVGSAGRDEVAEDEPE